MTERAKHCQNSLPLSILSPGSERKNVLFWENEIIIKN